MTIKKARGKQVDCETKHSVSFKTIADTMTALSMQPVQLGKCEHCSARMEAVEAQFTLYGTQTSWTVEVPLCLRCLRQEGIEDERNIQSSARLLLAVRPPKNPNKQ